jgi:hypothetical protein
MLTRIAAAENGEVAGLSAAGDTVSAPGEAVVCPRSLAIVTQGLPSARSVLCGGPPPLSTARCGHCRWNSLPRPVRTGQSARGLAHSKTLPRTPRALRTRSALVRWPSIAFPPTADERNLACRPAWANGLKRRKPTKAGTHSALPSHFRAAGFDLPHMQHQNTITFPPTITPSQSSGNSAPSQPHGK